MAFKPIDGKRDGFRKYLERTGVLEAISKVFIKLVNSPERPENAIEFIRVNLGDSVKDADTSAYLQNELDDARAEIENLKRTIQTLTAEKTKLQVEKKEQLSDNSEEESLDQKECLPSAKDEPTSDNREVATDEPVIKQEPVELPQQVVEDN